MKSHRNITSRTLVGLLCGVVGTVTGAVHAADRYVDPTVGSNLLNDCLGALLPCQTVQHAVVQSVAGDTVVIQGSSTVFENDIEIDKDLTLQGAGRAVTFIDGNGADRVIRVTAGFVTLDALTVQNGWSASHGGGIRVSGGTLQLRDARVRESTANFNGGGIALAADTSLETLRSYVRDNTAGSDGGGIHCDGCARVELRASTVARNLADGGGGGVSVTGSSQQTPELKLRTSALFENVAHDGGGVHTFLANTSVHYSDVSDNTAENNGGGLNVNGETRFTRSSLIDNVAEVQGGALFADTGPVYMTNTTVSGNQALTTGGLALINSAPLTVHHGTFRFNYSTGLGAHAIGGSLGTFELFNSIVHDGVAGANLCVTPPTFNSGNLIDEPVATSSCDNGVGHLGTPVGVQGILSATGGPGRYHAVGAASNAIDAATDTYCTNARSGAALLVDQAGTARPAGPVDCDIGADEL